MDFIIQNILNALQWGSFYALIALGYTLVYGVLTLINFAHGDIFMVGAYIAFFLASWLLGPVIGLDPAITFILAIPLTMFLTAGVGVTLERIAYRPLRRKGAHRLYVVITALMCGLILEYGNLAFLGASRKKFPDLLDKVVWDIVYGASSIQLFASPSFWGPASRAWPDCCLPCPTRSLSRSWARS